MATVFERGSHPTGNEHDGTVGIGERTLWGRGVTNPVSRPGLNHFLCDLRSRSTSVSSPVKRVR